MTPDEHDARLKSLVARFPEQFAGETIGIDIEPGWLDLVEAACADVQAWLDGSPGRILNWLQIKEKFGSLRMYRRTQRADAEVAAIIADAEHRSLLTCQLCGAPVERRTTGGLMTLCEPHATYPGWRGVPDDFDLWTTRFEVVQGWFGLDVDVTVAPLLLPILADLRTRHGHTAAIALLTRPIERFGHRTALEVLADGTVAPTKVLKILQRLA
jgi:hypothetical protein